MTATGAARSRTWTVAVIYAEQHSNLSRLGSSEMAAVLASCSVRPCLQHHCRDSLGSMQHQVGEALALCACGLKWNVHGKMASALTHRCWCTVSGRRTCIGKSAGPTSMACPSTSVHQRAASNCNTAQRCAMAFSAMAHAAHTPAHLASAVNPCTLFIVYYNHVQRQIQPPSLAATEFNTATRPA